MNDAHEVISAFLDDEPFDPRALTDALSSPAGRDLLVDLMALRHLTQINGNNTPALTIREPRRSSLRALGAVAAILVALVGGYLVGQWRGEAEMFEAPPATRVVQAPAVWQDVPVGRMP